MKKILYIIKIGVLPVMLFLSCQKMDRPVLGVYPKDANPPGGPLEFYTAFDGTTANPLMNAVDSIYANFPSDNPLTSVDGISGKAVMGASKKYIKYPSFNKWVNCSSFTISMWIKRDGQTKNNVGNNGPEHIFSLRSSDNDYDWSNSIMTVFLEGDNAGCGVKIYLVSPDPSNSKAGLGNWFTWEGGQAIPGILNNQWHHLALTYSSSTSGMTLYVDGVANPNIKTWPNHGAIRLAVDKIAEYRVGRGPRNDGDGDGESGWLQSSYKGALDQFRLYTTVLTTAEIQTLFNTKK